MRTELRRVNWRISPPLAMVDGVRSGKRRRGWQEAWTSMCTLSGPTNVKGRPAGKLVTAEPDNTCHVLRRNSRDSVECVCPETCVGPYVILAATHCPTVQRRTLGLGEIRQLAHDHKSWNRTHVCLISELMLLLCLWSVSLSLKTSSYKELTTPLSQPLSFQAG